MKNIVLIGFMGAGKTAVGKRLARILNREFVDLDAEIERKTGRTIGSIFASDGEDSFRKLEGSYAVMHSGSGEKIIATGGGFVTVPENVELLRKNSVLVYLRVTPETGFERVSRTTHRPLLKTTDPELTYRTILSERLPLYEMYADITIDTDNGPFDRVLDRIVSALKEISE